jgi:septum formation protein
MQRPKLILASASRWRPIILKKAGIPFSVEESGYEEDMTLKLPPEKLVQKFALEKALTVSKRHPRAIVIGADTVLIRDGKMLGKPKNKKEATAMLKRWSGKSGRALTGLAIVDGRKRKRVVRVAETKIVFRKLSASEISSYVATEEPMSGAGAFTIMNRGASFVRRIEGDFHNIAGLPLALLVSELKKFDVRA